MINKLIVVPNVGEDLFSLKSKYGIIRGPIKSPTAFPIEVIKALVSQYNKPAIYEVIAITPGVFSEPVLLTTENYDLPYEEIAGVEPLVKTVLTENTDEADSEDPVVTDKTEEVDPVVTETTEELVTETTEEVDPIVTEEVTNPIVTETTEELVTETTEEVDPVVTDETESKEEEVVDPVVTETTEKITTNSNKHTPKVKNR